MKRRANFRVVEFTNRTGNVSFRVTGTQQDGTRVRENYITREEATGRKQELEIAEMNLVPSTRLKQTKLSAEQIDDAEWAFKELAGRPMKTAIRFFLENYKEPVTRMPIEQAFEEFLRFKQSKNRRPDTIRNLRQRIGFLCARAEGKLVSDIQPEQLEEIISRPDISAQNAVNDRLAFSAFFAWAEERGYCATNPIAKVGLIQVDREEPVVLSNQQAQSLLDAAWNYKDGRLVPYVVLALFAAIRPTELGRLSWKEVDLEAKTVTIGPKIAKMRARRIVELSDNVVEWLIPHAGKTPIKGTNWRRDFDKVKELAGIKEWTQDAPRHTAISNHMARHEHEGKTATWAGNSPDVCQRDYRGLVKRRDAEVFWSLAPSSSEGKVVALPSV